MYNDSKIHYYFLVENNKIYIVECTEADYMKLKNNNFIYDSREDAEYVLREQRRKNYV